MLIATCHCAAVKVEVPRRPRRLTECNCSICRRYGTLWAYYKFADTDFRAIYPNRLYVARGGLASYGPIFLDQFRAAAGYVDRILKGEKPADLPVQAPTKYQMVLNLRTAKALGLSIPETLLATADEVIQ